MMREIKFRCWEDGVMINDIKLFDANENRTGIPMQYTGLKDKNGKEIYEGDIVSYESLKFEVKWDGLQECEYCCVGWNLNNGGYGSHDVKKLEVIGDIYQNPELLK